MALSSMRDVLVDIRLLLHRTGYARLLAVLLLVSAGMAHFVATPWAEQKIEILRLNTELLHRAPAPADQKSLQQERYLAFLDRLPSIGERPAVLKALFESSDSSGVVLSQAEYQVQRNDLGGYYRLRLSVPVSASYPKLRGFLDSILEKLPSASIDEISLHRETVSNPVVSANLKLSIYFKDAN